MKLRLPKEMPVPKLRRSPRWSRAFLAALSLICADAASPWISQARADSGRPDIVIITVDTLRFDRLSVNGYPRPTTPHLDRLIAAGARFTQARVVEPLTAPSMCSMFTSLYPHEHGTTRNGLRLRPELPSLGKVLGRRGYRTAAFVGNWTLKDQISGLGEHFAEYHEVFSRKRWLGLFFGEATAEDLTTEALGWLARHHKDQPPSPYLLWVHYVEPHAPYRFHEEFAAPLGIAAASDVAPVDRYDTEVAFVDRAIGKLLTGLEAISPDALIVFASDHGESLGEHGYWGHGRHLFEPTLRIPMSLTWKGRLAPKVIDAPASILDLAPTLFGLAGWPVPPSFRGYDWSAVLRGQKEPPNSRVTHHQAHKGAVQRSGNRNARRQGLLEVGRFVAGRKEIFRVTTREHWLFDLREDEAEVRSLSEKGAEPSGELQQWLNLVRSGLIASDELPPSELDEESLDQLKALGYID